MIVFRSLKNEVRTLEGGRLPDPFSAFRSPDLPGRSRQWLERTSCRDRSNLTRALQCPVFNGQARNPDKIRRVSSQQDQIARQRNRRDTIHGSTSSTDISPFLCGTGFIVSPKQVDPVVPRMAREPELLRLIDQIGEEFTAEFWHRYHELVAKRDQESLVPDVPEHQELIRMTDALEEWNAQRMGLTFELAKLRKTSIDEVNSSSCDQPAFETL